MAEANAKTSTLIWLSQVYELAMQARLPEPLLRRALIEAIVTQAIYVRAHWVGGQAVLDRAFLMRVIWRWLENYIAWLPAGAARPRQRQVLRSTYLETGELSAPKPQPRVAQQGRARRLYLQFKEAEIRKLIADACGNPLPADQLPATETPAKSDPPATTPAPTSSPTMMAKAKSRPSPQVERARPVLREWHSTGKLTPDLSVEAIRGMLNQELNNQARQLGHGELSWQSVDRALVELREAVAADEQTAHALKESYATARPLP